MRNGIRRKDKKILRYIMLCHTGNPKCRKSKYSKSDWIKIRNMYDVWFNSFTFKERQTANTVR